MDQLKRRVLQENSDEVSGGERGDHLCPRNLALHWTPWPFETRNRLIRVESNNQAVAVRGGFRQHGDVASMHDIEAAIGEADAKTLRAPFSADVGGPLVRDDALQPGKQRTLGNYLRKIIGVYDCGAKPRNSHARREV